MYYRGVYFVTTESSLTKAFLDIVIYTNIVTLLNVLSHEYPGYARYRVNVVIVKKAFEYHSTSSVAFNSNTFRTNMSSSIKGNVC